MDIITKLWEKLSYRLARYRIVTSFAAVIFIVIGISTAESGNTFAFVMILLGFWCFGAAMITELYHPDKNGNSRIRKASSFAQTAFSIFYLIWFLLLINMSFILCAEI